MLLYSNVNFDNSTFDSTGMVGDTVIHFTLPKRLDKRSSIYLKYFGYHAGVSQDNVDATDLRYVVDLSDFPKREQYQYRGVVKEVSMKVFANNVNVMHENVGSVYVDDENGMTIEDTRTKESLSFAVHKEAHAIVLSGGVPQDVNANNSYPAIRGYSQCHDLKLGDVETNVNEIKVVLNASSIDMSAAAAHNSNEPNIRMDTMSLVLELK